MPPCLLIGGIFSVEMQPQMFLHRLPQLRRDVVGLSVLVQVGAPLPKVARSLISLDLKKTMRDVTQKARAGFMGMLQAAESRCLLA